MNSPYLRPAPPEGEPSGPCPPGHVAEPAGLFDGERREVVYDPRRHGVLFLRGTSNERLEAQLRGAGWERAGADPNSQWWVRDKLAATQERLTRQRSRRPPARRLT